MPGSLATVTSPPIIGRAYGYGEAKAGAAIAPRGGSIGLVEIFEQPRLLLGRHADAGIGDRELDGRESVGDLAHAQFHLALLGELAGVAQKVEQNLPQPHRVDRYRSEIARGVEQQALLSCSASWRAVPMTSSINGVRSIRFGIEIQFAGLDLGEIKHLVDEAEQVGAGTMDAAQRLLRFFRAEPRRISTSSR